MAGDGGFLHGEAPVGGEVVRVLNLEALGRGACERARTPAGFLLLRRAGGVWGIANAAVDGLARAGRRLPDRASAAGALAADEILGVVESLTVRRAAPVLRRFWPEAPAGLAVHGALPVVVVDPRRPPARLATAKRRRRTR